MRYLCMKKITAGGEIYCPGETIPDGVILAERSAKLISSGYISELHEAALLEGAAIIPKDGLPVDGEVFTQEQVEKMIAEAVDEAVNNTILEMEQKQKELQKATGILQMEGFLPEGTVIIPVKGESDGDNEQHTAVPAAPEEIQQVFSIMQMNATDGAEAISGVKSENVLILLHAADTRKTIKDAAKKQADNIFSTSGNQDESTGGNATIGNNTEGADT